MRDRRFVAEHRGGTLDKARHRQLMKWAYGCAERVVPLLGGQIDDRLKNALAVARAWEQGKATTGEAMKASVAAHAAARDAPDAVSMAVARAIGQAVATAHMADHSMGGALYALKALVKAGNAIDAERKWQSEQLPPEMREWVLSAMMEKEKTFKMHGPQSS